MEEPRWLDDTEMRAWLGFAETSHLVQQHIDRQLREEGGVTPAQYEILVSLAAAPGRARRMSELAGELVASRGGMTYQIDQLEKRGLVRREVCPTDERGVLAILTDAGYQVLERTAPGHVRAVRESLIDALTPEQVAALAEILEVTRNHLRGRQARSRRGSPAVEAAALPGVHASAGRSRDRGGREAGGGRCGK